MLKPDGSCYETVSEYFQEHFRGFTKMVVHHFADVGNMVMQEREVYTN